MEISFGMAYGQEIVACSQQTEKDKFEKETNDIYNRLAPFVPNMKKSSWEEAKDLTKNAISYREKLLSKQIDNKMWSKFAHTPLTPEYHDKLPNYNGIDSSTKNIMLVPQKLISDAKCGVSAKEQSVPLEVFNFFKYEQNNNRNFNYNFYNALRCVGSHNRICSGYISRT
jgi:hypothetical protein